MDSATAFEILIINSDSFASVFTCVHFLRAPANFERTLNKRWGLFTRNLWRGTQWCIQYRAVPSPRRGYLSGELKQCWYNAVTISGNHNSMYRCSWNCTKTIFEPLILWAPFNLTWQINWKKPDFVSFKISKKDKKATFFQVFVFEKSTFCLVKDVFVYRRTKKMQFQGLHLLIL